jgi:hypothetical protein
LFVAGGIITYLGQFEDTGTVGVGARFYRVRRRERARAARP